MTIIRCASSHLMTELLAWRNPQGNEENWMLHPQGIENGWKHAGKVIFTEIGLGLLTITSVIETVAYAALALVFLTLYPFTEKPYTFFAKLLESSSFTIIWGLADMVLYNPIFINVMTCESFARYWAAIFNPTPITFFRLEDRLYIADWEHRYGQRGANINGGLLGPVLAAGRATQAVIDRGANFIRQDILASASAETVGLFKDMDPSIFMFILTKAIYIYTVGSKKNDKIPHFFKEETKNFILTLRQEHYSEATAQELQRLITNPEQFETEPQDESVKAVFNRLRNFASEELQNSLLVTGCWQRAIQQLPA